jgi:hypothetical protein
MFNCQDAYAQHLGKQHQVDEEEVQTSICKNRLGWNGEPQFWCGFCREIIPLRGDGLAAWNQRFNHIDIEHFRQGERIDDWFFPLGRVARGREQEDTQGIVHTHDCEDEPAVDGNSDAGSICSNYSEHGPHDDFMAVDRAMSFESPLLFPHTEGLALARSEHINNRKRKHHIAPPELDQSHSNMAGAATMEKRLRI